MLLKKSAACQRRAIIESSGPSKLPVNVGRQLWPADGAARALGGLGPRHRTAPVCGDGNILTYPAALPISFGIALDRAMARDT
jgi:hypothetical protein